MLEIKGKYTTAKIMTNDIEESALTQIHNMISNLAFTEPVAIMPDVHAGKGSVVGFTMPMTNKVIPNVIGVDIGCGMLSVNVGNNLNSSLEKLDDEIRRTIPTGTNVHFKLPKNYFKNNFDWKLATDTLEKFLVKYNTKFGTDFKPIVYTYDWFIAKCKEIGMKQNAELAIGTLGGGNHFIEIGKSEKTKNYWITIHSGSRNFGKMICEYHQDIAIKLLRDKRENILNEKIKEIRKTEKDKTQISVRINEFKKELGIDYTTDTKGLEYLEGQLAINYFTDMIFTQLYADFNRKRMIELIVEIMNVDIIDEISSVHNYINFDDLIIRKGAIRSYEGERMIIPFNMRDGLIIVEGKSNPEWNFSAPHGSGRRRSRGDAARNIDIDDFKETMKDVYSTSVNRQTLDEAPQAYKPTKSILNLIGETATILDTVKPVLNIKDGGGRIPFEILESVQDEKELARVKKNMKKYYKEKKKERRIERSINRELRGKNQD